MKKVIIFTSTIVLSIFVGVSTALAIACPAVFSGETQKLSSLPQLQYLRKDLPEFQDPRAVINYANDFIRRRTEWNLKNPHDPNNFPEPAMRDKVARVRLLLAEIKRPSQNRLAAERLILDFAELERKDYPYRDTFFKIHEVTDLVSTKYPLATTTVTGVRQINDFARRLPEQMRNKIAALIEEAERTIGISLLGGIYPSEKNLESPKGRQALSDFYRRSMSELETFFKNTEEGRRFNAELKSQNAQLKIELHQLENDLEPIQKNLADGKRAWIRDRQLAIKVKLASMDDFVDPSMIDFKNKYLNAIWDKDKYLSSSSHFRKKVTEQMFTDILFTTTRPMTIGGLAETYLIGLRPVEVARNPRWGDNVWRTSRDFHEHDIFHSDIPNSYTRTLLTLPLATRLIILSEVDRLETPRKRFLALYSIFEVTHEGAGRTWFAPTQFNLTPEVRASRIQKDYQSMIGRTISTEEAMWLAHWYDQHVHKHVENTQRESNETP